jgi:hypothetical protein
MAAAAAAAAAGGGGGGDADGGELAAAGLYGEGVPDPNEPKYCGGDPVQVRESS